MIMEGKVDNPNPVPDGKGNVSSIVKKEGEVKKW